MSNYGEEYFEEGLTKGISGYSGYYYSKQWDDWAGYIIQQFSPTTLCDIGCAKGFLVYALRVRGIKAYGVDISEYALAKAPKKIRRFLFRVDLNHEKLPFPNGVFDTVTCLETIEHIQNVQHAINEIQRVLKPNGKVLLSTPHPMTKIKNLDVTHVNVHYPRTWAKLFAKDGFHVSVENCHPLSKLKTLKKLKLPDHLIGIAYRVAIRSYFPCTSFFVLRKGK